MGKKISVNFLRVYSKYHTRGTFLMISLNVYKVEDSPLMKQLVTICHGSNFKVEKNKKTMKVDENQDEELSFTF